MGEKPTHHLLVALPSRQPGTISLQSSCCLTAFHSCGSYLQSVQFSAWFSYAGRVFRGDPIPQGVVTPARLQSVPYKHSRMNREATVETMRAACMPESLELTERMGRWLDRGLKSPFEISREFDNQPSR